MIYWEGFGSVRGLFEGGERNFASSRKKKKKSVGLPRFQWFVLW